MLSQQNKISETITDMYVMISIPLSVHSLLINFNNIMFVTSYHSTIVIM